MKTVIAILVLLAIVSVATAYIVREKKKGNKCIGCPYGNQCSSHSCNHQ